jgi:phage-related protein
MTTAVEEKEVRWVGSSYDDLLAFPKAPRKEAGFQLGKVQAGLEPGDWKPFEEVGAGTREIRIGDASGILRVMYVAKFEEAVYVLHCFQKKTQTTSKQDKDIAAARYRAVVKGRRVKP